VYCYAAAAVFHKALGKSIIKLNTCFKKKIQLINWAIF
jgi:hypothetical protein